MKKLFTSITSAALLLLVLAGCGGGGEGGQQINVISREDGSGTRGAFVELFGIEEKDADGNKVDMTLPQAEITNSTSVMMTSVAGDPAAIGYISLGSLNDTVKALSIDGVEATVDNINSGAYAIARPFNIATKENLSSVAQDFINFILSSDGQDIVESKGYIRIEGAGTYEGNKSAGKIVIAGSSSVTPVMEALKEAYESINSGAEIEIQQSDSTTGMNSVKEGICDIGMASRALKDSELESGLSPIVIAMDGIAVIVSNDNQASNLTAEQVKSIFNGSIRDWADLQAQ